ncbi:MAG: hypothetical protein ACFFCQ_15290, partial [Promethearchaeota archaeon]
MAQFIYFHNLYPQFFRFFSKNVIKINVTIITVISKLCVLTGVVAVPVMDITVGFVSVEENVAFSESIVDVLVVL